MRIFYFSVLQNDTTETYYDKITIAYFPFPLQFYIGI